MFFSLNRSDDHNQDEEEQEQQKIAKVEVNMLMHSASLTLVTYSEVQHVNHYANTSPTKQCPEKATSLVAFL